MELSDEQKTRKDITRSAWLKDHPSKNGFYCYNRRRRAKGLPGISEQEYLELKSGNKLKRGATGVSFRPNSKIGQLYASFLPLIKENEEEIRKLVEKGETASVVSFTIPALKEVPRPVLDKVVHRIRRNLSL